LVERCESGQSRLQSPEAFADEHCQDRCLWGLEEAVATIGNLQLSFHALLLCKHHRYVDDLLVDATAYELCLIHLGARILAPT